jgi:hypothetical protein
VPEPLLNITAKDGSRHFGTLPQTKLWYELRDHVAKLDGVATTEFVTDGVTEAWIGFLYQGYSFSINDQFGEYWFFVNDPKCPDEILGKVLRHCSILLNPSQVR